MLENPITPTIALSGAGKRHGYLRLPYSRDDSAWGSVMIPITVIANGKGPTALLSGANHGDEYEGPLALVDLALNLRPDEVKGRVIILPYLNTPAFLAGRRTSPIDGGNLNRAFPGRADGTITEKIADYVTRYLLPEADLVLDFHSGGKTLEFLPYAASHVLQDKAQEARCRAARDAFGAPYSLEMLEIDAAGMYDTTAEAMGKTFVTTELGGGGTTMPETVAIARKGLHNLLVHAGILAGKVEHADSILLTQPGDDSFHFAPMSGMAEIAIPLGQDVAEGDVLARIWPLDATGIPPGEIRARTSGFLIACHHPGLVQMGDCLAVLAIKSNR